MDGGSGISSHVGGDVFGQVVVGDHNVVINAHGSHVVVREGPPPAVTRRVRPVGRPLPRAGGELFGRATESALVGQWVEEGVPVEVCGSPGVGKSALLRRFAADRARAGRDVVFLHAAGLAVADVIQELFEACYDAPGYLPEPVRLRCLMGSIQALIVVDDFEGSAADLTTLADAVPSSDLVVSTTRRIAGSQARSLHLRGLDEPAALALLTRELGRRLGADEAVARELCRAAAGHPRALVQAASWLRTGGAAAAVADPAVLQRALIAGLDARPRQALTVLTALSGIAVPIGLCRVLTADPDVRTALETLNELGLVDNSGSDWRLAADPDAVTGAWGEPVPHPAGYAEPLLDWVTRTATPGELAAAAPVLVRVLHAAVETGHHTTACALARKVSPVLATALRWGSWRSVLKLGEQAALAIGSAGDRAYFEHEERIRGRALSAATTLAAGSAGVGGGLAAGHAVAAHTARHTARGMLSSHPVAIGAAAAAVVAAGVAGATLMTGQPAPVGSQSPLTRIAAPETVTFQTTTVGQPTTTPDHTTPPTSPVSKPRHPPIPGDGTDPAGACPPISDSLDFGTVTVGTAVGQDASFLQLACDDVTAAAVQGDPAFTAVRTSCPPGSDGTCVFRVTFTPTTPGSHTATLVVPDVYGNKKDVTIALSGTAAGSSTSSTPQSSSTTMPVPTTTIRNSTPPPTSTPPATTAPPTS
ncbi:hypothetical protein ACFYTQ_15775 [Nocardia sp. NPDC004068]|uniref:hypothetical protein n=1 Tax=Nocardia sp. NPDC004068 TaxID=3364303 RepID=UPI00368BDE8A